MRLELDQRCEVIGLRGENLLDQLLHLGFAVRTTLAFDFHREQIQGAQIMRIEIDGPLQVGDGLSGVAAVFPVRPRSASIWLLWGTRAWARSSRCLA